MVRSQLNPLLAIKLPIMALSQSMAAGTNELRLVQRHPRSPS